MRGTETTSHGGGRQCRLESFWMRLLAGVFGSACREGPAQVTQPPAAPGRPGLRGADEAGGDRVTSMVLASRVASHFAYGGDGIEQTDFSLSVTIAAALRFRPQLHCSSRAVPLGGPWPSRCPCQRPSRTTRAP